MLKRRSDVSLIIRVLLVIALLSVNFMPMAAVPVLAAAEPDNIALGKAYIASSEDLCGGTTYWPGYLALDGSTGNFWATSDTGYMSGVDCNEWLVVDLGSYFNISRWVVRHAAWDNGIYITRDFQLQYSKGNENGPWSTAESITGNTGAITDRTLSELFTARYVRLYVTKKSQEGSAYPAVRILEFEVYSDTAADVSASVPSGAVMEDTEVALTSATSDTTIYYTTDNYDPKVSQTRVAYSSPLELTSDTIIKTYAEKSGLTDSQVSEYAYEVVRIVPDPLPGEVAEDTEVSLATPIVGGDIFYTLDGSDPATSATAAEYTSPITIDQDTLIRACTVDGANESAVLNLPYGVTIQSSNVALNKSATTSSQKSSHPGSHAIDSDTESTYWMANDYNKGNWLQVDLGANYELTGARIVWYQSGTRYKYKIETSTDGLRWWETVNKTTNKEISQVDELQFSEALRRYVRITVTGFDPGARAAIKDFQVYGYASETVPAVPTGPDTSGWPRPIIVPLPESVEGVADPVISLGGIWKFTTEPSQAFWRNSTDTSAWRDIAVPGDLIVQGEDKNLLEYYYTWNRTSKNLEFFYKKLIYIPADYDGSDILIRFESAFNYARLWVNGHPVRTHIGGFTTWDTDITDYVTAGEYAWITVGLTDETQSLNFPIARGILGDVKLMALPQEHLLRLHTETDLDGTYTDATLKVTASMAFGSASNATVNLSLKDPSGNTVSISPSSISISSSNNEDTISIGVTNPLKWDAEHPNLYTLQADVVVNSTTVQSIIRKVGFREVEIDGGQMLVNGDAVKLRGVNYVNSYALKGIYVPDLEFDTESLTKLKEANVNYIRTSHMPQHEYIYDLFDELGFYVEEEAPYHFVGANYIIKSLNNHDYEDEYVNQMAETIEKNRSHASIIYRSYGNESEWGDNMAKIHDYAKLEDPLRPLKFSWGYNAPEGYKDIFSKHYPGDEYPYGASSIPEIYDEYAHIYVGYNPEEVYRFDMSYRDFYGESIKQYWESIYEAESSLGGAIWNAMDFLYYPEGGPTVVGATWGILDSWNREKPEYWHVKKAYSPIRINEEPLTSPGTGNPLLISVKNWYSHTNLDELEFHWQVGMDSGIITDLDIAPGESGNLTIPARSWAYGDKVELECYQGEMLVDQFELPLGEVEYIYTDVTGPNPAVTNNSNDITVTGSDFTIVFSKTTGLITSGVYQGFNLVKGGPHLNLGVFELQAWTLDSITGSTDSDEAIIQISGSYGDIDCDFKVRIDAEGLIKTTYTVDNPPVYSPSTHTNYYNEVGVAYDLSSEIDRLSWKKDGLWSVYPDDHIGRLDGLAYKSKNSNAEVYGEEPQWPWSEDEKDFTAYSKDDPGDRGTNDFRGSKKDFYYASLLVEGSNLRVRAEGDGTGSVRATINNDETIRFNINNEWGHAGGWGNVARKEMTIESGYTNSVKMRLTDNDNVSSVYHPSASLQGLSLSEGNLTPGFSETTLSYTANVYKETDYITVTPVASDPDATITVNEVTVASGEASSPIHLNLGENTITVLVTAVDEETVKEYTITVTRGNTVTDLVIGRANSASSAEVYPASHALDNNTGSFWATKDTGYQSSTACNEWLMVDLGQSYDIDRWFVKNVGSGWDNGIYNTRDYRLEYSIGDAEGPWMPADIVVGNTSDETDRTLQTPIRARYVRLYVTKKSGDGAAYPAVRIVEFKVFPMVKNMALEKNYAASSEDVINGNVYPGSLALDGSHYSFWATNDTGYQSSVDCDEWLMVDLGKSSNIGRWFVRNIGSGWDAGIYNTRDYDLEYSTGDSNGPWVVADSVVGNTDDSTDRTLTTPFTARYVRLHVTKDAGEGATWPAVRINEFELYPSSNIFNQSGDLALNKPASADTIWEQSVSADKAVDGNGSSRWSSLPNSTYPHWLKVDLGASYDINRVKLEWETAYAVDYKVQVSNDDSTWTDVLTVTGNSSQSLTHDFSTASARYVRIYVTNSSQGASNVSLWSVNVYSLQ